MLKTLVLFLFLPFLCFSQSQKALPQDYSFLAIDGEVTKLHQSNDTLYELKCYINKPCQRKPSSHYKILSLNKVEEFVILKLERLDTIALTQNPYPATRFQILALKISGENKIGYLPLTLGLTRQQLDSAQPNISSLKEKFFFTFFSDNYLTKLSDLKKITTKTEAKEIIEATKSARFKNIVDKYLETETRDMYGSGISAEILSHACIEKGYSPIGAGLVISALMRQ